MANGNPISWAHIMKNSDSTLASSHLEALMRVISRACGKLQSSTSDAPADVLRLRAVSIKAFTSTDRYDPSSLLDHILNSAVQCEKTSINNGGLVNYREILTFHEEMANILEERMPSVIQNLKFFKWLDHFSRVARMVGDYTKNIVIREKVIDCLSRQSTLKGSKWFTVNAQIISLKIGIISFVLEELVILDHEMDETARLKGARNAIGHFSDILKRNEPISEKVHVISQFFQSAESLRRPLIKIVEFAEDMIKHETKEPAEVKSFFLNCLLRHSRPPRRPRSGESIFEMTLDSMGVFTEEIALCLDNVITDYFNEYKDYYLHGKGAEHLLRPDRISLVLIDTYELLSRFSSFGFHSENKFNHYIEQAFRIAQRTSCIEGLRTISNAYYRIAVYYYNDNQIKVAVEPMRQSCEILCRCVHELLNVNGSSEKSVEEFQSQLSKRFEVLGACWNLLGEFKNARDAFEKSLRCLPKSEFFRFAALASSQGVQWVSQQAPIIPKLIERYIKLSIIDCTGGEFTPVHEILMDFEFDSIVLAGLFEYELRVLRLFDDKIDSSNVEFLLYEKLLEWYDGVNYPIRRARILIEGSKIASHKKVCPEITSINLIEEALDLLKTDNLGQDSNLVHLRSYYLAIAYSWMGILTSESESRASESFKCALTLMKGILTGVPSCFHGKVAPLQNVENSRKNVDDGYLEEAINSCTESLRIFNRLMRNISRNFQTASDRPLIEANPFIEDRVVSEEPTDGSKENIFDGFLTLSAQRWKWRVSQRLLECYNKLGRLHILRGGVKEAEYMFKQALLLTDTLKAKPIISQFLLDIAELEYRKHCWEESEDKLSKVSEYHQKAQVLLKEAAKVKLCLGDFKRCEGDFRCRRGDLEYQAKCYDLAINSYQHANEILNEIMKNEFISKIEQIDTSVFQTPRCKKLVTNLISTPNSKEFNESEHIILHIDQLFIACKSTGWLISKKGDIDEGLKLIELGKFSDQSCLEKAEYLLLLGKTQIMKISSALVKQNCLAFDNVQDSVLSLPLITKSTKRRSRKTNQSLKLEVPSSMLEEIDKAIEYLTEVYDLVYECGPTRILQEAGLCITMAHMIKVYGQNQSDIDQIETVSICSLYLEMSKALTAKREMVTALNEKLKPPLSYNDMRWPPQLSNSTCSDNILVSKDAEILDEETMSRMDFIRTLSDKYKNERLLTHEEFIPEFSDILPHNWTVCSISIDVETNDMYVCRYRREAVPLLLRLPLKRQSSREGEDEGFSYDDVIGEFNEILELSGQSMRVGKEYQTKQEKLKWWKERKKLDERMKNFLENIENCWFGGFKGILMAHAPEDAELISCFKKRIDNLLSEACKASIKYQKRNKLDIEIELCRSFLRLGEDAMDQDIEDILYFLVDAFNKYNDQQIGYDEVDWDQLTVNVREMLSGSKKSASVPPDPDQHVILILDKNVQMLPWESLPCLRHQPVSRLPSFSFLRDRIMLTEHIHRRKTNKTDWSDYAVDPNKCFFVLNPGQDLKNTQDEFENFVKSPALVANLWDVTDRDIDRFSKALFSNWNLQPNEERFDENIPNVQNIDSDTSTRGAISLVQAVSKSRDGCVLKYLIGSAPVVYGIPCYLKR
ncbi:7082_t:CDS:10 [Acaulospora colombiana]|uniref:7082_t:CDS:1 n=1 Tax=Acaulospora colombiana TaxID=27376 RepID=A0ACA9KBX4_9GLOM|nr:7082_t:CDS:10 [Acaulospora colombiana]